MLYLKLKKNWKTIEGKEIKDKSISPKTQKELKGTQAPHESAHS